MQIQNQHFQTFKSIKLNDKERAQSDNIIKEIQTKPRRSEMLKGKLFADIFQKHIEKEATLKADKFYYKDDVLQELYLHFFELINNIKNTTTEDIVDSLNKFKPNDDTLYENNRRDTVSLNKNWDNNETQLTMDNILTEDSIPEYTSNLSNEEKIIVKNELKTIERKSKLSPKEKLVIEEYKKHQLQKQVSEKLGISTTVVHNKIASALSKMQYSEGTLPKQFDKYTQILAQQYKLNNQESQLLKENLIKTPSIINIELSKIIDNINKTSKTLKLAPNLYFQTVLKHPTVFLYEPKYLSQNAKDLANKMNTDIHTISQAVLQHPQIICQKPETLMQNISELSKNLDISIEDTTKICLKQPTLLCLKPQTAIKNITELSEKLDIPFQDILKTAIKHPTIFCKKPEKLSENIKELSEQTGIDLNHITKVALKEPRLLDQKPATILKNINLLVKKTKVDLSLIIKAALKQPNLFCQNPETLIKNITQLSKRTKIDPQIMINTALKQPQLFYQKPETIINNITELARKTNVEKEVIIKSCLKQPQLFCQNPDTLIKNITQLSENTGIKVDTLINIALKEPQLFYLNPNTIMNNLIELSKKLDINIKDVIQTAINQPNIFMLKPETSAKKIKINNFYKLIQGKKNNKISFSTNSEENLYKKILLYLIKDADKLTKAIPATELVTYLSKQNKTYKFTLPEHELKQEVINYITKFSETNFKKQIFKIL